MYHLAVELLQPFFLLYLVSGLLLLISWRKRGEVPTSAQPSPLRSRRRVLLALAFLALGLCCTPAAGYLALGTLEWPYPPLEQRPEDAQAIVVLAGYVHRAEGVRRRPELGEDTVYRCLRAAELYHQGPPYLILVSGNSVKEGGPAIAPLMRDFLVKLGVSASNVIVESQSRTTWENAVESHKLLEQRGIRKVILVTDAPHLFRAVRCFAKQGVEVVPCGCRYRASAFHGDLADFLPSPSGAQGVQTAWHEWLGSVWYWMRGRI
jgi:uncharacterized SAM-binding protein YcdF (DUF218 family)